MSRTRCALRDLRKTWATCLVDRFLNLFSIRLFKCNVYGDRTRFTPYTTLNSAKPRGKQRAEHRGFYKSLLGYCTSKSRASSKSRFNPTRVFSLGPGLFILFGDRFHDLIWISETLFHNMITLLFMIWSYFLSCACHASSHDLIILPVMCLSCFFSWPDHTSCHVLVMLLPMTLLCPFFYDLVMTHCPGSLLICILSFVRISMHWDYLPWAILVSVFWILRTQICVALIFVYWVVARIGFALLHI